jgi:LPXTG-motif cell wall-anchored protein
LTDGTGSSAGSSAPSGLSYGGGSGSSGYSGGSGSGSSYGHTNGGSGSGSSYGSGALPQTGEQKSKLAWFGALLAAFTLSGWKKRRDHD